MAKDTSITIGGRVFRKNPEVDRYQIAIGDLGDLRMSDIPPHSHIEILGLPQPAGSTELEVFGLNGGGEGTHEYLEVYGGASFEVEPSRRSDTENRLHRAFPDMDADQQEFLRNPYISTKMVEGQAVVNVFLNLKFKDRPNTFLRDAVVPFIEGFRRMDLPYINVFICHASEDKDHARELHARLTADALSPWLDEIDLKPGQDWDLEIRRAVRAADAIVVLLSSRSVSKRGYLQKEIRFALDAAAEQPEGTSFLIPGRLEECAVPDSLRRWHYVDLFRDGGHDRLVSSLRAIARARSEALPATSKAGAGTDSKILGTASTPEGSVVGTFLTPVAFERASEMLLSSLKGDEQLAPLLNGVHLPICLPPCKIGDYGRLVDEFFLPPVRNAYKAAFPKGRFQNSVAGKLGGQLGIARASGQETLLQRMTSGPVVGILFPAALQGFSVQAAREQLSTLPAGFVLSGVLDTCIAMVSYTDVLATDHSPTLVCAGTTWQSDFSLCFHPGADSLQFCVADVGFAVGSFSPGLLYIGG